MMDETNSGPVDAEPESRGLVRRVALRSRPAPQIRFAAEVSTIRRNARLPREEHQASHPDRLGRVANPGKWYHSRVVPLRNR